MVVDACAVGASADRGQGIGVIAPEKVTNGPSDSRSFGPTPGTLSRRARLPKGPCAARHATIRCASAGPTRGSRVRSEEHTSELQSRLHLVCRLLLEKKKTK